MNNPHERPYLKHEEKELREQIDLIEKAITQKQLEKTISDAQKPQAGCSLTSTL